MHSNDCEDRIHIQKCAAFCKPHSQIRTLDPSRAGQHRYPVRPPLPRLENELNDSPECALQFPSGNLTNC